MRIIGGELKGKKIDFLKTSVTRPIRDLIKESVFNVIQHSKIINMNIQNCKILDLYSGVGSFGIECISRGAKNVEFVENNSEALKCLKKNISTLCLENKVQIHEEEINFFLSKIKTHARYNIIFLDPPFAEKDYISQLNQIKKLKICSDKHIVIIHREKKSLEDLSNILKLNLVKEYGRSKVIFGCFLS